MDKENNLHEILNPQYHRLENNFTEIIAAQLHYFEKIDNIDFNTITAEEIIKIQNGSIDRYRRDHIFHAKVQSMVAHLIQASQKEHEERLSKVNLDVFKIVPV